jgi:hypothetical protein
MKIQSLFVVSIICFFCTGAFAESGGAVTGLCKDGSSYTGASKRGACRGHKGVKEWYGDNAAAATSSPAPAAAALSPAATAVSGSGTATGLCKDGTPYTGASKKGACRGHKGIKEWYGDNASANTPAAAAPATATPAAATSDGAATGLCKDGTVYTGASKRGACRGHKGIKEWYADKQTPAASEAAPAAAAPAVAADGTATGLCKDGTVYTGSSKRGACRGHKGVKEWYADKQSPAPAAGTPAQAAPAAAAPTQQAAPASTAAPAQAAAPAPAPAAGSGKVWVNTHSKIYHCEGSKFYGKTKEGEYMNEADAQAKGYVANRKKACN